MGHGDFIGRYQLVDGRDVFIGNDEYVSGCNGMDVSKGCRLSVLVHNRTGTFPSNDLTKYTIIHDKVISPWRPSSFTMVRRTGVIWFW